MPDECCTPVATAATSAVHVLSARLSDLEGSLPGLAGYLALVPDHRRAQGRRHSLVSVLSLACAATAAGAKSLVVIAEWTAAAPALVLDSPRVRRDPVRRGAGAAERDHDPPGAGRQ